MSFAGRRVLALESRRAAETAELIRRNGGDPAVAVSMQEAPLGANSEAFEFADRLFAGAFDAVILLTGVGTRYLGQILDQRYGEGRFAEALRGLAVVARGPKPVAVCREWNVPVAAVAPEPNTWHEVLEVMKNRPERRVAIQLYGKPHPELESGLRDLGAKVSVVPVYQWTLPQDLEPLRSAVKDLAGGSFAVVLFTTSQQVVHLFEIAAREGLEEQLRSALRSGVVVGSIGPTTTEMLREYGVEPDLEPSHPKLGIFVREMATSSEELRRRKAQPNATPAS
jgi:uroporphyrinogen-III synthase